jgi:hypothetical protein
MGDRQRTIIVIAERDQWTAWYVTHRRQDSSHRGTDVQSGFVDGTHLTKEEFEESQATRDRVWREQCPTAEIVYLELRPGWSKEESSEFVRRQAERLMALSATPPTVVGPGDPSREIGTATWRSDSRRHDNHCQ